MFFFTFYGLGLRVKYFIHLGLSFVINIGLVSFFYIWFIYFPNNLYSKDYHVSLHFRQTDLKIFTRYPNKTILNCFLKKHIWDAQLDTQV